MTKEEAIETLKLMQSQIEWDYPMDYSMGYAVAIDMAVDALAEPERKCADCKWWDRLEENHPYGYCLACKSGTHTNRWDISIRRLCKYDFFCADAEPKEDEDGEE